MVVDALSDSNHGVPDSRLRLTTSQRFLIALILIGVLIHWQWFIPGHQFRWEDSSGVPSMAFFNFGNSYGSWLSLTDLGSVNVQVYQLMFFQLWHALAVLGLNYAFTLQVTMLWPIALLSFISPFLFIKHVLGSDRAGFVGALIYGTSGSLLFLQGFEVFLALGFALLPLVLFMADKLLRKQDWKSLLQFVLLFSLLMYIEIRVAFLTTLILVLFVIIGVVSGRRPLPAVPKLLLGFSLTLGLNLFWLNSVFNSSSRAISELTGRGVFGNQFTNFQHALTLLPGSWVNGSLIPFTLGPIPILLWFLPIGAIGGMFLTSNMGSLPSRATTFFGAIIAWLGVLLATQANPPLPFLYPWVYVHIPGFSLFRVGTDFAVVASLGYGLLIGRIFDGNFHISSRASIRVVRTIFAVALSAAIISMIVPVVDGQSGSLFVHRDAPIGLRRVTSLIGDKNVFFRTLWLPSLPTWSEYSLDHPAVGAADLLNSGSPLFVNIPYGESIGTAIVWELGSSMGKKVLEDYSVRYLILPPPDSFNSGVLYSNYGEPRSFYSRWIRRQRWLVSISNAKDGYGIFRVVLPKVTPLLMVGRNVGTVVASVINSSVIVGRVVKRVKSGFAFDVSMSYNAGWHAYVVPDGMLDSVCSPTTGEGLGCHIGSASRLFEDPTWSKFRPLNARMGAEGRLTFSLTENAAQRINVLEQSGGAAVLVVFDNYWLQWQLLELAELLFILTVVVLILAWAFTLRRKGTSRL